MNKLLAFAFILISIISMNCSTPQEESAVAVESDKLLALEVEGMVCEVGCAKYIEKQVAKIEGVTDCTVNFEEGKASISYSSMVVGEEDIVEVISGINDGQYGVTVLEVTDQKSKSTSGPKSDGEEVSETEVSFHFPELVTYFMSRIIR